MMTTCVSALLATMLLSPPLAAADLTGTWQLYFEPDLSGPSAFGRVQVETGTSKTHGSVCRARHHEWGGERPDGDV